MKKKKNHKWLSLMLMWVMVMGIIPPIPVSAETITITEAEYPGYGSLTALEKTALQDLKIQGKALKNSLGMYIAIKVLTDPIYNLAVYENKGKYLTSKGFGDPKYSDETKRDEPRYLGYSLTGEKVTNDKFQNDTELNVDPATLTTKKWSQADPNLHSWKQVSADSQNTIFTTPFGSTDGVSTENLDKLTLSDILRNTAGFPYTVTMNPTNADVLKRLAMVHVEPTFTNNGSIKLVRKVGSVYFWNSFIIDDMKKNFLPKLTVKAYFNASCTDEITKLDLLPDQTQKTIYLKVSTNVDMFSIGLGGKESNFIASVENFLNSASLGKLTTLANPSDVFSVMPVVIERKDYGSAYKTLTFKGKSQITPKSQVVDINKEITANGSIQIRAINPLVPNPEFDILYGSEFKTDQAIVMDDSAITKDYILDLKDKTLIPKDGSIKNYNWFVWNYIKKDYDYFAWTKDTTFTLKPADVLRYAQGRVVKFKEVVADQADKIYFVEHSVNFIDKPIATEVLPKAYVYPPKSVRAGVITNIKGEGTSPNGGINYAFQYGSSFKVTQNNSPSDKDGTFLSYGSTETTTLTVTDNLGKTATDSDQTLVNHPLEAVVKTNGVYKIHRTIELDSSESTGTTYYPIDQVAWTIIPMEGQPVDSIKTHDNSTTLANGKRVIGAKPKVDFKALGRYDVYMEVHSTCTYSGETARTASKVAYGIINIQPDQPPVAKLSVPSKVIRDFETMQRAIFEIWDQSYSSDGDSIGKKTYYYRYDTDNDKSMTDETWEVLYEGMDDHVIYSTPLVGNYEFRLEVEEANESNASPFWNPLTDTLTANTDSQLLAEKKTEVINVAPITAVMADRKKVDLVFATDFEGSDLSNLQTQVTLMVKNLYESGIDVKYSIINSKIKSGTMKAPVYEYARNGNLSYTVTYSNVNGVTAPVPYNKTDKYAWETRYQLETDYMPNYGATIPTTIQVTPNVDLSTSTTTHHVTRVNINAPADPFLKSGIKDLVTLFGNAGATLQYQYTNIAYTLNGFFEKLGINTYQDADLYTIDLSKVSAYGYREEADKRLVFVTKNGNSLVTLSDEFKNWVKEKNIAVSTITTGSLFDEYGFGQVENIGLTDTATLFKTDMKQTYKIGDVTGTIEKSYPMLISSYPFSNNSIEMFENQAFRTDYGPIRNIPNMTMRTPGTKTAPTSTNLGGLYVDAGSFYLNGSFVADKAKWWTPLGDYAVALVSENSTVIKSLNRVNKKTFTVDYSTGRTVVTYQYPSSNTVDTRVYLSELDISKCTGYNIKMATDKYNNYNVVGNGMGIIGFKNGDLYGYTSMGYTNNTYYDTFYNSSGVLKSTEQLYDNWVRVSISKIGSGSYKSIYIDHKASGTTAVQVLMMDGKNIRRRSFEANGGSSTFDFFAQNFQLGSYDATYPSNVKKLIYDGNNSNALVLCEDGKVYASGQSTQYRYGVSGTVNKANPIFEYRSVSNATPVSLNDILSLNTKSRAYASFENMESDFTSEYRGNVYQSQITRLVGEPLEFTALYGDFEGDPIYASSVYLTHDPNALENSIGLDENHGKTLTNWNGAMTKTGLYTLHPKVQDNPNEDNRFSDYRLWNKDDMTLNVLVHRRPVAMNRILLTSHPTDGAKMILTASDKGSYDTDHLSEAQRGITAVEWGFKASYDSAWQISTGTLGTTLSKELIRGDTYLVSYRVKDKEGEWSDPVVLEILAGTNLLFDAKLKPKDPSHDLIKFQAGNNVTFYNVWSSYEMAHQLEVQLYDGTTPIGTKQTVTKSAGTVASEDFPETNWTDIDFLIPKGSLEEKTYKVRITAVDSVNPSVAKYKEFPVTIVNNSPPTVSFVSTTPESPYEGDEITNIIKPLDPDGDLLAIKYYLTAPGGAEQLIKTWTAQTGGVNFILPDILSAASGQYMIRVVVNDPSGASAEVSKSIWVNQMAITANFAPTDPMAGDALYFDISTTGYVDKVEIIPDQVWIVQDNRVSKGYKSAPYADGLQVGSTYKALQIDMDQNRLTDAVQRYRYQVWVSVPQSVTLKGARLRAPYSITIRAWKGSVYRDKIIQTDLQGSVLQTLKFGTPNK